MRRMYSENQLLKAIEKESAENGIKVYENVVDKDGHARFIEGDIVTPEITGVTQTYGKWSLSGSHLLMVLGFSATNATVIPAWQKLGTLNNLPSWILDKIAVLFATNIVDQKTLSLYNSGGTTQQMTARLLKTSGEIQITVSTLTLSDTRDGRISFDLLIDNE